MKFNRTYPYLLLFFAFFISGCSETTFLVNSAKRIGSWGEEPIYKIGNPYEINGKWYYPALDYDYNEIGYASWYGPGFHGKKTANGEIFDQNKISAAHKTLPLPSVVKVTNLDNGKILSNIRVNDRGPFSKNRIIDLSKKAAEKLGFVGAGIAKVKVEILEDESRNLAADYQNYSPKAQSAKVEEIKSKRLPNPDSQVSEEKNLVEVKYNKKSDENQNSILKGKDLAIQVGAFTDHRNAKSLIEKLAEFKAYIQREFVNEKYMYRVRIGPIENINIANEIKDKLFNLGHTTSHLIMN